MADIFTIDASVFLNAFNKYELGHEQSQEMLERLKTRQLPFIEPTLLLPELAASIARVYGDEEMAQTFAESIQALPSLSLITLDASLAELATDIAAQHRLRGSDAVYAAVARRYGTTLVTLDQEQYQRVSGVVTTETPTEVIAGLIDDEGIGNDGMDNGKI